MHATSSPGMKRAQCLPTSMPASAHASVLLHYAAVPSSSAGSAGSSCCPMPAASLCAAASLHARAAAARRSRLSLGGLCGITAAPAATCDAARCTSCVGAFVHDCPKSHPPQTGRCVVERVTNASYGSTTSGEPESPILCSYKGSTTAMTV